MTARRVPDLRLHLALLVVQLSFSGLHVFGKVVLEHLEPLALACLRVLFATPLLFFLALRRDRILPPRRLLPRLALLGLFGVFTNQILFIVGLRYTTATNASILMPSIPVFTVAVALAAGVESAGPRRLGGIALAVAGALVLLDPRGFTLDRSAWLGNLMILVNCLSYSAFLVLQRKVLEHLPWRTTLAWAFLFGSVGVLAVGGPTLLAVRPAAVPAVAWWGVAYVLLFPTALGYSLNIWAVRRSSPTLAATYITLQPLTTALLAAPLLGDRIGVRQIAGFLLVAAGLWLVSFRRTDPD